MYLTL